GGGGRNLLEVGGGGGREQFQRVERVPSADSRGSFHHHAGGRFFRLAKGQLARLRQSRSVAAGGDRCTKSARFARPQRTASRKIHGHPGTGRGAGLDGLYVLGLRRLGDSGPALVSQQPNRNQVVWRKHHHRG